MSDPDRPSTASIAGSLARGRRWIVAAAAISAALTWWLVASTPTRWVSMARLELGDPENPPASVVALIRGGAVLERLRAEGALAARLDLDSGDAFTATARLLTEQVQVVAGDGPEVWVTAWDVDGERARDLVAALVEVAAAIDHENRVRRAAEAAERLELERRDLVARLDAMAKGGSAATAAETRWAGIVDEEVEHARIRRLAERLAAVEAELEEERARAADPRPGWRIAEAPAAWHHPLPRRLGGPVVAALTLPLLVAALAWLAHDHRRR